MSDEAALKILRKLTSDLVMIDAASAPEEWRDIADASDNLAGAFLANGESDAQEMSQLMGAVAGRLATGIIANPADGVKVVQNIISVLQGMETSAGMSESLRKQAHAEANLFLKDLKKEESFVNEASSFDDDEQREMIIALEQRIDELEEDLMNLNPPETDPEIVRAIFRQYHTLKGEGAICGIKSVAEYCHGIETEIEGARHGQLVLTHDVVSALQSLTDLVRPILAGKSRADIGEDLIQSLMEELHEAVQNAQNEAPQEQEEDNGEDKFADFFSGFEPPPMAEGEEETETDEETPDVADFFPPVDQSGGMAEADGESPPEVNDATEEDFLRALGEIASDTRMISAGDESAQDTDADTDASGEDDSDISEVSILSGKLTEDKTVKSADEADGTEVLMISPEKMTGAKAKTSAIAPRRPAEKRKGGDTVIESGDLVEQAMAAKDGKSVEEKPVDATELKAISVDVHILDNLMELVSEVSLLGSYFSTQLGDNPNLSAQANNLSRACNQLQETATSIRMTSIRPLFMSVRRAAVEGARSSRKLININMRGTDTQVDRSIVENLSAALIHVIRNAVDHGIEPAEARKRAGKSERGTIFINATRTDSDVIIELGDDGKGFDLKTIHDKAVAMGKITPDAVLTDEEVADLVFLPGLSTAKKITGLSGRGVGMEIVRESIDSLRGRVEIKTVPGKGSTIKMRFPLTIAAMEGMLVKVGKNTLIFPVTQVRECFRPTAKDIGTIEGKGTIVTIRGVVVPVLFLGQEFGIEADAQRAEDGVLVVVEAGELITAVLVDDTLGSGQVIIRSLDGLLSNLPLVAGAAILPDRSIGLVVETSRLTERVSIAASKAFSEAGRRQADGSREIDTVSIGSNQVGVIDFTILGPSGIEGKPREYVFAINAFKTKEFVPLEHLQSLPNTPPGFAGMMMVRGHTVPIVHMGVVLGLMSESERRQEWEQIVLFCEFAGRTVGFLVTRVNRVSYISWSDIMPPPSTGGLIQLDYIVGSILTKKLKGNLSGREAKSVEAKTSNNGNGNGKEPHTSMLFDEAQVAFVLDFERIVGNVIQLYGDMGSELGDMGSSKKGGCRILLVEDSPLIRKQTVKALTKAGITVIEAGDGQEAWEKITEMAEQAKEKGESIFSHVDLVLSDIEMPRMDGYTFTHNLKHDQNLRVLPVLLHSSITNDSMISRATEVEADGFIPKCDPKELAAQLRKYL